MLCGGTFVVDHASGLIIMYNQMPLGTSDTISSKELYEMKAHEFWITVNSYRGENGVYKTQDFVEDLKIPHQTMIFSGVESHDQNGIVERAIKIVVNSARTMMLHQALLWSKTFDMRLWPFALDHAAYLWNHLSNGRIGIAPIKMYIAIKLYLSFLKNDHIWGCPEYVLDPRLQDSK